MRKMVKSFVTVLAISGLFGSVAYGGVWQTDVDAGTGINRWWYDCEDGTYESDGWSWIDDNNDGIAECYYFDTEGWLLTGTTTPDGYQVNESGQWVSDNVVQTKAQETAVTSGDSSESVIGTGSKNGRYVYWGYTGPCWDAAELDTTRIYEESSEDTRIRYYLEEMNDGSLKYTEIWYTKNYLEYDNEEESIEDTIEQIYRKTGENTYVYEEDDGVSPKKWEIYFSGDDSFIKTYSCYMIHGLNANGIYWDWYYERIFFNKATS